MTKRKFNIEEPHSKLWGFFTCKELFHFHCASLPPLQGVGIAEARHVHRRWEKGIALILVLWVITFLSIIAAEFAYSMKIETSVTRNFKESAEGYFFALAGFNMAIAEIMMGFDYNYLDTDGKMIFVKGGEKLNIPREFELNGRKVSYTISDEESKININTASRDMIWNLLKAVGIDIARRDIIADSILDWRDANNEYHLNGAESDDFYLKLSHPYEAKNGFFDSHEELLLVKGVAPDIFYGRDMPQGINFSNPLTDVAMEEGFEGIYRYITTIGTSQININTASEKVLIARFGDAISQKIISTRNGGGFFQQPAYGGIIKSTAFTISARGYSGDKGAYHEVKAVVEKRIGQKPEIMIRYWNNSI